MDGERVDGAREDQRAARGEEGEWSPVELRFAATPRPPEADANEVVEVNEGEIGFPAGPEGEPEDRRGDGDAEGAARDLGPRKDHGDDGAGEGAADAEAKGAGDRRAADDGEDPRALVEARAHDEIAHVGHDVGNAPDQRANGEHRDRERTRDHERREQDQRGDEGHARLTSDEESAEARREGAQQA